VEIELTKATYLKARCIKCLSSENWVETPSFKDGFARISGTIADGC
jgi:hypothetical protein